MPSDDLRLQLAALGLRILASFQPEPALSPDPGCRTLVLIGPDGRKMWPVFAVSPEHGDGRPDALDRWTFRVVSGLAADLGLDAYYPFGNPHRPFVAWALASGQVWQSPVGLLVHSEAGLLVSFRAALALGETVAVPLAASPCDNCILRPCLDACPASALGAAGYDTGRCHDWLDGPGQDCLAAGCLVRRACPVGRDKHDAERAGFHMRAFHSNRN